MRNAVVSMLLVSCTLAACKQKTQPLPVTKEPAPPPADPNPPPPRAKGKAKSVSNDQLNQTQLEAERLTRQLLDGGISPREVTATADIHGYRLYRRRRFAQALVWFELGVQIDPTFEPCLYNAARAAARSGKPDQARAHLAQLKKLDTPLAQRRLRDAQKDPDLAQLR